MLMRPGSHSRRSIHLRNVNPRATAPLALSWALPFFLIAGLILLVAGTARADEPELLDSSAPVFQAKGLDGKTYDLQKLLERGPVFLDFWTTWCKPCQAELPKLQELYEKYGKRGFTLVTVASDDQRTVSKVKPMVKSRRWSFPILLDPKREIGNPYQVRSYPTSYLIAPGGKIASVSRGYRPGDEKEIEAKILALLPEPSEPAAPADAEQDQDKDR
jgi:cytochrome c biogenesis protein CcmG/thiol:disulfide interchange protein DsbE